MADPLWRVWFEGGGYQLVSAPDTDHVYRGFKKAKRETIVRVDRVLPTSEGVKLRDLERATRAGSARASRPSGKGGARSPAGRTP